MSVAQKPLVGVETSASTGRLELSGLVDEVVAEVKEKIGDKTDNDDLKTEGQEDQLLLVFDATSLARLSA